MTHDEYWKGVADGAHERLEALFAGCHVKLADIVEDDSGIDSFCDAKKVLAWAMEHADNYMEKACAILSIAEIVHAHHELNESK